jgi:hypothetical protein
MHIGAELGLESLKGWDNNIKINFKSVGVGFLWVRIGSQW